MARSPFAAKRSVAAGVEGWLARCASVLVWRRAFIDPFMLLSIATDGRTGLLRGLVALHLVALAAIVPVSEPSLLLVAVTGTGLVAAALVLAGAGPVGARAAVASDLPLAAPAADEGLSQTVFPPRPTVPARPPVFVPGGSSTACGGAGADPAALMGRISHEIRTPLNAVIGFSDLMEAELFGPLGSDRYRDYVRHIRSSGHELLKSAEDTLALTSAYANPPTSPMGAMDAIPLAGLVQNAFLFAAETVSPGTARLQCLVAEDIEVLADQRALRQILVNLFEEAIVQAGGTGTVTIAAVCETCRVQIQVTAHASIPAGPGTSLRLSVARTLLELYGSGLLVVEDEAGRWRAVTLLDRATQSDFFAASGSLARPSVCDPLTGPMPHAA